MIFGKNSFVLFGLAPLAILLGIAAGFRIFGSGRDYLEYFLAYQEIRLSDTLDILRFEPGYVFVSWVAKFIVGIEFAAFFSVLAAGSLLLKFQLFSQNSRPVLTAIFYLCCWYPLHEYTQIRTGVALAFCFLAAEFFFRRRFLAFGIVMGVAISFHSAALVVALAIPVGYGLTRYSLRLAMVVITGFAVCLAAIYTILVPLAVHFNPLVEVYLANIEGSRVTIFSISNLLTAALLGAIVLAKSLKSRRDATFFILAFAALAAAIALQGAPVFSHRIKEILLVFLVPLAFNCRLTKRTLPQYMLAATLAGWTLHSSISQGIVGAGT